MNYIKYIVILVCIILATTIAYLTRTGLVQFTYNFSYLKIGSILQYPDFGEFDSGGIPIGTTVLGRSGFPFGAYECQIGMGGTMVGVKCNNIIFGEMANFLNIIFWFFLLYILPYRFYFSPKK